jgi:ribose transport system substrate-binding protein
LRESRVRAPPLALRCVSTTGRDTVGGRLTEWRRRKMQLVKKCGRPLRRSVFFGIGIGIAAAGALAFTSAGSGGPATIEQTPLRNAQAARALVAKAKAPKRRWIGPTSAPKPATGKVVGIIPCAMFVEGCAREARGAIEAARAIGWRPILIDGKVSAQVQLQAMNSLISRRVDAIILASVNASSVGEGMARAKRAGIPIMTSFAQDPDRFGGLDNIEIVDEASGEVAAAYMALNGGGSVMVFDDNSAEEVIQRTVGLRRGFKKYGGAKELLHQNISGAKVGPPEEPLATSLFQRYPEGRVQWVYCGYDFMCSPFVRVLQRRGRDEVKVISFDGNLENLAFIRKGQNQVATIGYPLEWAGWAVIDNLNRHFNDAKLWPGTRYIEFRLLDRTNLPPAGKSWQGDIDFRARFKKLWGVK